MERKRFISEVYAKSWPSVREKLYGFMEYDKNLCNYIRREVPAGSKLLEVAVGTGYPVADYLQKTGYEIHGIDISSYLIDKCRELNPNIKCKVGDAEALEYEDNTFDAAYCFHSTWYFPNLNRAIDDMVRVTRPGGIVIFDIQNRNNSKINEAYINNLSRGKGVRRIIMFARNLASMVLRRRAFNWHFLFHYIVHEVPAYPEDIYQHLRQKNMTDYRVMVKKEDETLSVVDAPGSLADYGRLIFVIEKNNRQPQEENLK